MERSFSDTQPKKRARTKKKRQLLCSPTRTTAEKVQFILIWNTSYVPVTGIDLVLPDDITQPTVTITAVFTPSDAANQKVTWKFNDIFMYMDVVRTTDTSCFIKAKNSSLNSFLKITATASNGVTVSKTLVHTSASLGRPNGTWGWD